jgi:anti-sigma regulatory factor (Ser/Thr protein kinase)
VVANAVQLPRAGYIRVHGPCGFALMSRRCGLLGAVILVVGIVVVIAATVVTVGMPVLLGVVAVLALVVGLLPRSRRQSRREADGAVEVFADPVTAGSSSSGPSEQPWLARWDSVPPPGALVVVRARTARELTDRGLPGEQVEAALLVVTELLSNAIEHGCPPVRLRVSVRGSVVRVEVHDTGPGAPQEQPHDLHRLRGRGLYLVEALSTRWGWTRDPTGKTVWTDIAAEAPA